MADPIRQTKLQGHRASVLCLAHSSEIDGSSNSSSCLLSGSEDGTARIWDLRTNHNARASLCVTAPGEVTSVAFSPLREDSPVTHNLFSRNFSVYLGVGHYVLGYDLRMARSPIIREPTIDLTSHLETAEEINQISFSSRETLRLAVGDDAGFVRVTDSFVGRGLQVRPTILRHDDDGLGMVTSCVFHPLHADLLASGGTDCTIHSWDVTEPRVPFSSHLVTQDDSGTNQVCNPPMIHSMTWSPSGQLLVAGLGDGTIQILALDDEGLVEMDRLRDGHDASVASVVFPDFGREGSNQTTSHDRLLASAGSDGVLLLWDLGGELCDEGAMDPARILAGTTPSEILSSDCEEARIIFGIQHEYKPNWMVSSRGAGLFLPSALFVADTTNDITVYSIPLH